MTKKDVSFWFALSARPESLNLINSDTAIIKRLDTKENMNEELTEQGIVVKSEEGITEIELLSNENCEECSAKLFCKPREDSSRILQITSLNKLSKGDKVSISVPGKSLLLASLNLYLYPLLILIFSIFIGSKLFSSSNQPELYSLTIGIILVVLYYLAFVKISKILSPKRPNVIITKTS